MLSTNTNMELTYDGASFREVPPNDEKTLKDVVALYIDVFGAPPWNEGFIHQTTGELRPLSEASEVKDDPQWRPFYDASAVLEDFKKLHKKPSYTLVIGTIKHKVIGLCNGWSGSLDSLNEQKFKLPSNDVQELMQNTRKRCWEFNFTDCFYLAEMAIHPTMQGRGYAHPLYTIRQDHIDNHGYQDIMLRTSKDAVPFQWAIKKGFCPVYEYGDAQNRVILAKKQNVSQ